MRNQPFAIEMYPVMPKNRKEIPNLHFAFKVFRDKELFVCNFDSAAYAKLRSSIFPVQTTNRRNNKNNLGINRFHSMAHADMTFDDTSLSHS